MSDFEFNMEDSDSESNRCNYEPTDIKHIYSIKCFRIDTYDKCGFVTMYCYSDEAGLMSHPFDTKEDAVRELENYLNYLFSVSGGSC